MYQDNEDISNYPDIINVQNLLEKQKGSNSIFKSLPSFSTLTALFFLTWRPLCQLLSLCVLIFFFSASVLFTSNILPYSYTKLQNTQENKKCRLGWNIFWKTKPLPLTFRGRLEIESKVLESHYQLPLKYSIILFLLHVFLLLLHSLFSLVFQCINIYIPDMTAWPISW